MASRPLIKMSLQMLHICGLDPHKQNIFSNVRKILSASMLLMLTIDLLFECILNWQGLKSMPGLGMGIGAYQILAKLGTMVLQRRKIVKVLCKMEEFWPVKKYGSEVENEVVTIYTTASKVMKLMLIISLSAGVAYSIQPIFGTTRKLPFQTYYPVDLNQSPHYELAYALHEVYMVFGVCCLTGFDWLLVSLIINVACELKMIKKGFGSISINPNIKGDNEKSLDDLYKLVSHHNLILHCIKDIKEIYSMLLLNVFFFNMVCMCFGLLAVIYTGLSSSVDDLLSYGLFLAVYIFQLLYYCLVGSHLTDESEKVSAAVYNTNWWIKTQPELRKAYVLVIRRANKAEKLTAGGMFDLNLDSFTKVMKGTWTFFTCVQATYKGN